MSIDQTLRLLAKARGLTVTDIATAIPRAGVSTVSAWMRGDKLPGKDQLDALARTFGVPAGALLSDLASTLDPARTKGAHRSEARRVGKECVSPCSSRWSPYPSHKQITHTLTPNTTPT